MKIINLILFVLGIMLLVNLVSGFAVSSYYGGGLKLYAGEERDIFLTLQNMAGSENLTASASIDEGSEIAKLTDPSIVYFIPLGTHRRVNITLKIPPDAEIGKIYNLTLSFNTVDESKSGQFGFSSGITRRLAVEIIEKPKPEGIQEKPVIKKELPEMKNVKIGILIAAIIIIVSLLIVAIWKRLRHKKRKK